MTRVLIIEDDKLARKGLITTMPWRMYGMEVVGEAANGAIALELLKTVQVDLCFVDLMMPVMDGLEFIRRASEQYPMLDYVVISFQEEFGAVQASLRLGVLDYISKLEFEHADLGGILARINSKLHTAQEEIMPEEENTLWKDALRGKKWLFDREAFTKLTERLLSAPAALSALERGMMHTFYDIEKELAGFHLDMPKLQNMDQTVRFLQHYRNKAIDYAFSSPACESLTLSLLKAVAMVERDCAQDLHTGEVAAGIGLSRPYFSNCFSQMVGIPFNVYLRRERINRACELLRNESLTVEQIANKVGYLDLRSFCKLFREQTGKTPSEYRKNA